MDFVPPRCPNVTCPQHASPDAGFFIRRGYYQPRCRTSPVPRFRCRTCRKSFSFQTFRYDRGDRRPECNGGLFLLLTSGVGLRQSGRVLKLDIHSVQGKQRKMARTFRALHGRLSQQLPAGRTYLLDEEETYEGASIRPLTMPVLIEKETWFVVATAVGSIRRLAPPGTRRRQRQDHEEELRGARRDESNLCVVEVLRQLAMRVAEGPLVLRTDQKASYGTLGKQVFGDRLLHETTAGTLVRATHNPLFAINTTLAMTRDNCGRLRRRSWLVSKKGVALQDHLAIFTMYRNYVRRRFNRDQPGQTSAQQLRLLPRALTPDEVLAWRQDWGDRSVHPMDRCVASQDLLGVCA